ncbi:hypothetical protein [Malacoplasma iowae]|uniref:hypothetical protein n=1 Tax=Malacoplasma iowae TaxID=2116 RepID=UPI002A189DE4|nr:hypothetical protein [Malacoplasma iowae]WPL38345.1 hypothetical protein QX182_02410 [Malacoplasma iowae]
MEKVLNGLDWLIYSEDYIENKIYLNKNELLYRFSQINFDNIYIDSLNLLKVDGNLLNSKEFNINYNESVYSLFFDYASKINIPFIYNGYHLKNILLNIAYNFSKCSIPFEMVFKIEKWCQINREENVEAFNNYQNQKSISFNSMEFNSFLILLKICLNNLKMILIITFYLECLFIIAKFIWIQKIFHFC